MPNGVIKTYSEYKKLGKDERELHNFEIQIGLRKDVSEIKIALGDLKSWKIKVVGIATGVSAVIGFMGSKVTDWFQ